MERNTYCQKFIMVKQNFREASPLTYSTVRIPCVFRTRYEWWALWQLLRRVWDSRGAGRFWWCRRSSRGFCNTRWDR